MDNSWKKINRTCPKCHKSNCQYRIRESSCGSYEDEQYECLECGNKWWIDGSDY